MTATSVSGNPSKQEQLVGRRAPNGETCSFFFWVASIATRIKLGNIRMSSSQLESRNYPSPCGSSSLWRMGDQSKDRGDGLFSQGHFALMRGGTDGGHYHGKEKR